MNIGQKAWHLAEKWFGDQCRNAYGHYYLYYRPIAGPVDSDLLIAEDSPGGDYLLADPRRISPAWTRERALIEIKSIMQYLPILGGELQP